MYDPPIHLLIVQLFDHDLLGIVAKLVIKYHYLSVCPLTSWGKIDNVRSRIGWIEALTQATPFTLTSNIWHCTLEEVTQIRCCNFESWVYVHWLGDISDLPLPFEAPHHQWNLRHPALACNHHQKHSICVIQKLVWVWYTDELNTPCQHIKPFLLTYQHRRQVPYYGLANWFLRGNNHEEYF